MNHILHCDGGRVVNGGLAYLHNSSKRAV